MNSITTSAVCIPNISTSERQKRLKAGEIELAITLAILAGLVGFKVRRGWRLLLFPLFLASAEGFFQWRDHT